MESKSTTHCTRIATGYQIDRDEHVSVALLGQLSALLRTKLFLGEQPKVNIPSPGTPGVAPEKIGTFFDRTLIDGRGCGCLKRGFSRSFLGWPMRLGDAGTLLKQIPDYLGHGSPSWTVSADWNYTDHRRAWPEFPGRMPIKSSAQQPCHIP
jgi:hypothetical protein